MIHLLKQQPIGVLPSSQTRSAIATRVSDAVIQDRVNEIRVGGNMLTKEEIELVQNDLGHGRGDFEACISVCKTARTLHDQLEKAEANAKNYKTLNILKSKEIKLHEELIDKIAGLLYEGKWELFLIPKRIEALLKAEAEIEDIKMEVSTLRGERDSVIAELREHCKRWRWGNDDVDCHCHWCSSVERASQTNQGVRK